MLPGKPTRTEQTERRYKQRTKDLVRRCRKEMSVHAHEALDYRRFVGWMVTHKTQWSRPTWRQYKASVVYVLEQEVSMRHDAIAQEALEALLPIDVEGCPSKTEKTSGSKLKKFPLKEYRALLNHLDLHPSPWSADLVRWLGSSLLVGLRPQEWGQTQYATLDGEDILLVTNAKATNDRAHGPTRTILLGGLTDDERSMIQKHVTRSTAFSKANDFKRYYHGCAATLARVARFLWPQRKEYVTLYSARHQFSADAKASGFLPEELAALMGHAVDITAAKHYGKKTAGFEMVRVRPHPDEVKRIRSALKAALRSPDPKVKMMPVPSPNDPKDSK